MARIKRQLHKWRRYQILEVSKVSEEIIEAGQLKLDKTLREVFWQGEKCESTNKEFEMLVYLAENKNRALSREAILHFVWGADYIGSDRAVDDLVKRLRKKIPDLSIESIWGFGYRFKVDERI